jgi:Ca-activated chloride channel family protein
MNNLTFAQPWMLALLWLAPLAAFAFVWLRARRQRRLRAWLADAANGKSAAAGAWRFNVQLVLISLGFALAFVALARPRYGEVQERVTRRGRDLMIVLDVSRSMLAADAAPSRLERAKADLIDLVNSLGGDRAGLILFRHKAVPACPLTTDYAFLLQMLDAASPDSAAPGETDIGDAILKALASLELQQSAHQAIVLVSDGEDLAGTVDDAVAKAKERGITIFTVGFGSAAGSLVPDEEGGKLAYQGAPVTSKLNAGTLRTIAARTGGIYVPVGTARVNLGDLYNNHLSKLQTREQDETVTRRQLERFSWFLLPAILLFLAAAALSAGRPLLRKAKPAAALLALLLGALSMSAEEPGAAGEPINLARRAQEHYRAGRYDEAADFYRKAAGQEKDRQGARDYYNAGCALYQAGKFSEAAEAFQLAGASRPDAVLPWAYNRGCALLQDAQAVEATNAASTRARADRIGESAKAFQETVRAGSPARREQALNNLALAGTKAEESRLQAREMAIQEKYGALEPAQLAQQLLDRQRKLELSVSAALSNSTPSQIAQLEAAGAEASDLADLVGPLAGKLEAALAQGGGTNAAAQAAALRQHAAGLNHLLTATADRLKDAEPGVQDRIAAGERASYLLWKSIAPFDLLLREDIRAQSNLVGRVADFRKKEPSAQAAETARLVQGEAADLTRLFARRFEQAVPEGGQPAAPAPGAEDGQADTNNPGITAETRAKILKLAAETAGMQGDAVKAGSEKDWSAADVLARDSLAKLKEIEDLLPKQKQNQDQQQQQQQDQQQKQDDQQKQDQPQPKNEPDKQPDQQPEKQPEKQPEQKDPNQDQDEMTEEKARELLQKARLREKEYQDEKRKKAFFDRAPGERDW